CALPVVGRGGALDVELRGEWGFVERPAALGADVGQRCLVDLVDLLGAGRRAVGLGAVVLAGLAAGLLGLVSGLALGEGRGLPLAGTGGLIELPAEALVLGLQVTQASLKGVAAGTRDGVDTSIIPGPLTCSCARSRSVKVQPDLEALIKYSASRHSLGQPGARGEPAARTAQAVQLVLGYFGPDRRQFQDLMAKGVRILPDK